MHWDATNASNFCSVWLGIETHVQCVVKRHGSTTHQQENERNPIRCATTFVVAGSLYRIGCILNICRNVSISGVKAAQQTGRAG